jgi:hypothetical protein
MHRMEAVISEPPTCTPRIFENTASKAWWAHVVRASVDEYEFEERKKRERRQLIV